MHARRRRAIASLPLCSSTEIFVESSPHVPIFPIYVLRKPWSRLCARAISGWLPDLLLPSRKFPSSAKNNKNTMIRFPTAAFSEFVCSKAQRFPPFFPHQCAFNSMGKVNPFANTFSVPKNNRAPSRRRYRPGYGLLCRSRMRRLFQMQEV